MTVCRSQNMVYKRRREEPVPESDDDSELDEDEKEALVHALSSYVYSAHARVIFTVGGV